MGLVHDVEDNVGIRLELISKVLPEGLEVGSGGDDGVVVAHEAGFNWSVVYISAYM